ncbi:MAG TPA: hypothetical protein DCS93_42335 [Microscillaceae bacterium]|nr:hypothetical protein [Microscillaceae bacterium]
MRKLFIFLGLVFCIDMTYAQLDTSLILSKNLSRTVQTYTYKAGKVQAHSSIVYFTDGHKLIEAGFWKEIDRLTAQGKIPPAYYVFVSSLDPDNPATDFREEYFFCNQNYLDFFAQELIPTIEDKLGVRFLAKNRGLVGVSFGGLNAAYFSAKSKDLFQNYALLSPITYPGKKLMQHIAFSSNQNLRIFLSTGKLDAENYLVPLQQMYQSKGYTLAVLNTGGDHSFDNWRQQLEAVLTFVARPH